jgi:hypothetical protein
VRVFAGSGAHMDQRLVEASLLRRTVLLRLDKLKKEYWLL